MQDPESFQLQDANSCILCVDIGGTTTKIGALHGSKPVSPEAVIPTKGPADRFARELALSISNVRSACASSGPVLGVGVAVAGMLDDECTQLFYNPNIAWLEKFPLRDFLRDELQMPVALEADSTAATLAEFHLGVGAGLSRFMCVTVGTGIGVGMILDGNPLRLAHGCLGDPGHIKVQPDGESCMCGGRGCAEVLVSAPMLAARYRVLTGRPDDCTLRDVIEDARTGEATAVSLLAEAGHWLGVLSASLADTFLPQTIGFAGGLAEAGPLVLDSLNESFARHASTFVRERVTLKRATLGSLATLAGAAFSVQSRLDRP
jgi:glucokinase